MADRANTPLDPTVAARMLLGMRPGVALVAMIVAAAPAISGLHDRPPVAEGLSNRSIADALSCVTVALTNASGYEIRTSTEGEIATAALVMRAVGVPATVGLIEIFTEDQSRHLQGFATGKRTGAPAVVVRRAVESCAG